MTGGNLVLEARRRAGITQRELAERMGTTQAAIARWEGGKTSPSFEKVVEAVRACGLELAFRIVAPDRDHRRMIYDNLLLTPRERLERATQNVSAFEDLASKVRRK